MKLNPKLQKLYKQIDNCKFCKADKNPLQHIHGFGSIEPDFMLILINPTYRNLSSDQEYKGMRFPFIGVRQFWKVLADGGMIDKKVAYQLPLKKDWNNNNTKQIQQELIKNKLFLTNIVKCCYKNSSYPDKKVIQDQLKILSEEIKIVQPKRIITFSSLVFKILTGKNVKFYQYWNHQKIHKNHEIISGLNIPVIPCYFPIGRGNPKKAAEILNRIKL